MWACYSNLRVLLVLFCVASCALPGKRSLKGSIAMESPPSAGPRVFLQRRHCNADSARAYSMNAYLVPALRATIRMLPTTPKAENALRRAASSAWAGTSFAKTVFPGRSNLQDLLAWNFRGFFMPCGSTCFAAPGERSFSCSTYGATPPISRGLLALFAPGSSSAGSGAKYLASGASNRQFFFIACVPETRDRKQNFISLAGIKDTGQFIQAQNGKKGAVSGRECPEKNKSLQSRPRTGTRFSAGLRWPFQRPR